MKQIPPSMHPADLLKKAENRAWIELASTLNMDLYHFIFTENKEDHGQYLNTILGRLKQLENKLSTEEPYFNGKPFCLVDAAFAPFFMRLEILSDYIGKHYLEKFPRCLTWHLAMKEKESVKKSVVEGFKELFLDSIKTRSTYFIKNDNNAGNVCRI